MASGQHRRGGAAPPAPHEPRQRSIRLLRTYRPDAEGEAGRDGAEHQRQEHVRARLAGAREPPACPGRGAAGTAAVRAVDTEPRPGGSSCLTVREISGVVHRESFLDQIVSSGIDSLRTPERALDVRDYVDLAMAGVFPEPALRLSAAGRRRWMTSYVIEIVNRDALAVEARRDPQRLRRFFDVLAVNSAEVIEVAGARIAAVPVSALWS